MATRFGVDYSMSRPGATALRAAGYTFACRYLAAGSASTAAKALTKAEADGLRASGVDLVSNWEISASAALKGRSQGVIDAQRAASLHTAFGGPAGRPIYFSVDFNATAAQQAAINAYFDGVASVLGLARTGAYGGYWVISRLFNAGKIRWGWQTYAWSGGQWDSRAQLRQVQNGIKVNGADCDKDQAVTVDFGQWGATAITTTEVPDMDPNGKDIEPPLTNAQAVNDMYQWLALLVGGQDTRPTDRFGFHNPLLAIQQQLAASAQRDAALLAAFQAVAAGGTSIDTQAVIAHIDQVAATESATVATLQGQLADVRAKLVAAGQGLAN